MSGIGVLVKGRQGEEYLVMPGPEGASGAEAFLIVRREPNGWAAAHLSPDEASRVRADAALAIYRMARQCRIIVPLPIAGKDSDAFIV